MSSNELIGSCIDLVTRDGRSFSLLDASPFRTITGPLFKGLGIPVINSHNVVNYISEQANNMTEIIKKSIKYKIISLKLDIATRKERSVLGINVQLIMKN